MLFDHMWDGEATLAMLLAGRHMEEAPRGECLRGRGLAVKLIRRRRR